MRKFKKILPFILFTTLGLGSLVGCGEVDPIEEEKPGENEDNGNNENGNEGEGNEGEGNDGDEGATVPDDKEPEHLNRYEFLVDKLTKDQVQVNTNDLFYTATANLIESVTVDNCYSVVANNYALRIGSKNNLGSLTFTFKEDIYIKNITLDMAKTNENYASVNIKAGGKSLDKDIINGLVKFEGVNKYTKTLTITRTDDVKFNKAFYLKAFEINSGETPNIPKVKLAKVKLDDVTGGKIEFKNYSNGANVSLNTVVEVKATPTSTDDELKTLIVNDGTSDLDIIKDKKFTILKENATYTVKATFGAKPVKETSEENFKVLFNQIKTDGSDSIDKKIITDESSMVERLNTEFCWTAKNDNAIRLGSSNNEGKITFTFTQKVLIKKLTLTLGQFGTDTSSKAIVTLGTKTVEYPLFNGEVTMPLNGETFEVETLTIKSVSGRILLKGFEINGTQEEKAPEIDEDANKATVKIIKPQNGKLSLSEVSEKIEEKYTAGWTVYAYATPDPTYKLKSLTYKIGENGTKTNLKEDHSFKITTVGLNVTYFVEAEFQKIESGGGEPEGPTEPETPLASNFALEFGKNGASNHKVKPSEAKDYITDNSKALDITTSNATYFENIYSDTNSTLKLSKAFRLGTADNKGHVNLRLNKPTIINSITFDLEVYKVAKSEDLATIKVLLDDNYSSGEYEVKSGKLTIYFNSLVTKNITITNSIKNRRFYLKGMEVNAKLPTENPQVGSKVLKSTPIVNGDIELVHYKFNESVIEKGSMVDVIVKPSKGYKLQYMYVSSGSNSEYKQFNITGSHRFRISEDNLEYTITPTFVLDTESTTFDYETQRISFNNVEGNDAKKLSTIETTYTDYSNIVKNMSVDSKIEAFGGTDLRLRNKKGSNYLTIVFNEELTLQNVVINAKKYNTHNVSLNIDSPNYTGEALKVNNIDGELLRFTFDTPLKTDTLKIEITTSKEESVYLSDLFFNYELTDNEYYYGQDYVPVIGETSSVKTYLRTKESNKEVTEVAGVTVTTSIEKGMDKILSGDVITLYIDTAETNYNIDKILLNGTIYHASNPEKVNGSTAIKYYIPVMSGTNLIEIILNNK